MRDQFAALLLSQVGVHEGRDPDGTWNNHQRYSPETPGLEWSQDQPWCATFQAWAAHQLGMDALWPMTASCLEAVAWWKARGQWSSYPVLGGPFYLGPDGGTHTGTVVAYDADTITTVEGNSNPGGSPNGDGVYQRVRPRRGTGAPYGYGVPAYPEGAISADPRLGGTTAAAVVPPPPATAASTISRENTMPTLAIGQLNKGFGADNATKVPLPPINGGAVGWGQVYLSIAGGYGDLDLRAAVYNDKIGDYRITPRLHVPRKGGRVLIPLQEGDHHVDLERIPAGPADKGTWPAAWMIEASGRG